MRFCQLILAWSFSLYCNADDSSFKKAIRQLQQDSQSKASGIQTLQSLSVYGHSKSQYILGDLYLNGDGVIKNTTKAVELFQSAADSKIPEAINALGWLYATGTGVKRNTQTAKKYYQQASELNLPDAQYNLAELLISGIAGDKDIIEATHWYIQAANNNHVDSQIALGKLYSANQPTVSFNWHKKAADNGHPDSQFQTGWLYLKGIGTPSNPDNSYHYFLKSANQGHIEAMYRAGSLQYEGFGTVRNRPKGLELMKKATQLGFKPTEKLSSTFSQAKEFDLISTISTASEGNIDSVIELGWNYWTGNRVTKNNIESYAWFNLAVVSYPTPKHLWVRSFVAKQLSVDDLIAAKKRAKQISTIYRFKKPSE